MSRLKKNPLWIVGIITLSFVVALGSPRVLAREAAPKTLKPKKDFPLDQTPLDRSDSNPIVSYAGVLEQITPSVVSVYTARIVRIAHRRYDPHEEMLRRFFGLPPSSGQPHSREEGIEERRLPSGIGSGVIVSQNGYILTNNHVISNERGEVVDEILIRLHDGSELSAEVIGRDAKTDVAVLKVEAEDLPQITMADSENLRVGDLVFAIGNPLGIGQTVTMGIISATGRSDLRLLGEQAYENFIQTDASINPGNSGGALIDAHGRLIGINAAIISRSGGNIGIGFAVPINLARSIMIDLIAGGTIQRGLLGVAISDLDADMAEAFGLKEPQGALIQNVEEGLPAARAGIRRGDVIIAIDEKKIKDAADLRLTIAQIKPETVVTVTLLRKEQTRKLQVRLGNLDDPFEKGIDPPLPLLEGLSVEALNEKLRTQYEIDKTVEGLLISAVEPNSTHSRSLRKGMVLIEINDQAVKTLMEARQALRLGVNKLWVYENGAYGFLTIRLQ